MNSQFVDELANAKILTALKDIHNAFTILIKADARITARSSAVVDGIKAGLPIRGYSEFLEGLLGLSSDSDVINNASADCGKLANRLNTCCHLSYGFPSDAIRRAEAISAQAKALRLKTQHRSHHGIERRAHAPLTGRVLHAIMV